MRILQILSGTHLNGAVGYAFNISELLAERGHDVLMLRRPQLDQAVPSVGSIRRIDSSLKRSVAEIRRIGAFCVDQKIDVIHTHMSSAHAFGALLRLFYKVPCVATAHKLNFQLHWALNDRVLCHNDESMRYMRLPNLVPPSRLRLVRPFIDERETGLAREPRVAFSASIASISQSVSAAAGGLAPWPVLVTTADHALLTPAMVEDFIAGVGDADVAVALVERANLLGRYPGNRRTWLKFRGGAYSGANLFALTGERARAALELWAGVEQDRKKGWKLVAAFGPLLLVRALTRTVTLQAGLAAAGRRLGLTARPVVLQQPEAAIDVDKPADHELAESILSARG